jgi:nucleoid-associated protein Lsr2
VAAEKGWKMARQVITTLVDDLDGSEAEETVHFGLDGVSYEIDLSGKNGLKFRQALEPYILAGAKVGRGGVTRSSGPARTSTANREENTAIRVWAGEHGFEVSERGRIPGAVMEAYRQREKAPLSTAQAATGPARRRTQRKATKAD